MNRLLTLILAGLSMVGPLAIDTYLPSFPAIAKAFDVGPLLMQQSLSLFLFTFAFMMLFYGTLSDSFGRRPVILVSLVVYILASLGAALTPSFGGLLICRVLQGLAAGAGSVVSRAIIQDKFAGADAQRMLSHVMMLFGLAPAIAPILGGWLQVSMGWRSVFWFLTSFGVLMFVVCYRALPESLPTASRHAFHPVVIASNYLKVMKHHRFLLLAFAVGLSFSGFALYIGSAANFVMNILHKPETAFAWLFIPLISGMVAGSAMSAKHAARYSPKTMILAGYGIMAAASIANIAYNHFFAAEVPWAVLPLFFYAFGLALITPAITIIAMSYFPDNRGLASSLQAFIQMFMFALVSGFVAPVLFESAFKLACGVAVGLVLSFSCWLMGQPKQGGEQVAASAV
ncbi:multidrug effflux MFS transporter [Undibacterium sp.]|uniref:multidrug effflux MFS transporter n=1 Tax=Undibacterium sp. TaxID=1914977 RepID=UPI00374D37AD